MNQLRGLLFPDWDLESLLMNVDPTREDDFSTVVSAIQANQLEEAEAWLASEISGYPWVLMAAAYVKLRMNEAAEAGRLLRAVTLISSEARLRLWAWHNLRSLGKYPSPELARQVLGVIIEIPYDNRADVLAAYADGSARYINHQGGMIVWDRLDETITPLVMNVIRLTQPVGGEQDERTEVYVQPDQKCVRELTAGGMFVWEGTPGDTPEMTTIFAAMAELLRALVQITMEQRRDAADEEEL